MNLDLFAIKRTSPDYEEESLAIVAAKDESEARILAGRATRGSYAFDWCDPAASTCTHIGAAITQYDEPKVIDIG